MSKVSAPGHARSTLHWQGAPSPVSHELRRGARLAEVLAGLPLGPQPDQDHPNVDRQEREPCSEVVKREAERWGAEGGSGGLSGATGVSGAESAGSTIAESGWQRSRTEEKRVLSGVRRDPRLEAERGASDLALMRVVPCAGRCVNQHASHGARRSVPRGARRETTIHCLSGAHRLA